MVPQAAVICALAQFDCNKIIFNSVISQQRRHEDSREVGKD